MPGRGDRCRQLTATAQSRFTDVTATAARLEAHRQHAKLVDDLAAVRARTDQAIVPFGAKTEVGSVFPDETADHSGRPVQFQSQWWLEEQGFFLPSVMSVSGSRGELANALRLDLVIDDQMLNCIEVISSSFAKSVLLLRDEGQDEALKNAQARGIGVVSTLEQAIDVAERLQELLQDQRGALERVTDWFPWSKAEAPALPLNPREIHRLPPDE